MPQARIASVHGPTSSPARPGKESAYTWCQRSEDIAIVLKSDTDSDRMFPVLLLLRGQQRSYVSCHIYNILICCSKHNTYVIITTNAQTHFLLHQSCRNHASSDSN